MSNQTQDCDQQHHNELLHYYFMHALMSPQVRGARGSLARLRAIQPVNALVQLGCDETMLLDSFAMAAAIAEAYPPLSASALKMLKQRLTAALQAVDQVLPSGGLLLAMNHQDEVWTPTPQGTFIVEAKTKGIPLELDYAPFGGNLSMLPDMKESFGRLIDLVGHVQAACSRNALPGHKQMDELAYVLPVAYIETVTGAPQYALVAELWSFCSLFPGDRRADQIGRSYRKYKAALPSVFVWMSSALGFKLGSWSRG